MKEPYKVFLSITSIIAGLMALEGFFVEMAAGWWYQRAPFALIGVGLLAAGLTYFWTRSRFFKG